MVIVLPFHSGDVAQAVKLLNWIQQLGGAKDYPALLVPDDATDWADVLKVYNIAVNCFDGVDVVTNSVSVKGWPQGPNSLFLAAAKWMAGSGSIEPWLWLETDAVPLHCEWAKILDEEYDKKAKLFLGHIYDCAQPGLPKRMLSGVALYGPYVWELLHRKIEQSPGIAFDVLASELVLPEAAHTHRIQHFWGEAGLPPSFPRKCTEKNHLTLSAITPNAILFHRNKDGTLIDRLRERMGFIPERVASMEQPARGTISIRRTAALGDVLASTVVAQKLMEQGFDVVFQAHSSAHCILRRVTPPIKAIVDPNGAVAVDLDGAYEKNSHRRELHFAEMFLSSASQQCGFTLNTRNFAPRMKLLDGDMAQATEVMFKHPRPWTVICPRSNSWANRTVPDQTWQQVAAQLPGTVFWSAMHPAPAGIVDLSVRHFDRVIGFIGAADLLVTVDTGPMHVAAALGVPVVAIQQASSPELHLSDQRDFIMVSPNLTCLNCQIDLCPINATTPPCQNISADVIARAANDRLKYLTEDGVSVVICCYKPKADKLNRCLNAVIPQVDEVFVVCDLAGVLPREAMHHPKLRYIRLNKRDVGYGRKANYGVRHTNHRYVLLLNDDCYLDPTAVSAMRQVMGVDVGAVSHELRYPDGSIQHGGTYRAPGAPGWGHLDHRAHESRIKTAVEMENVCGASLLVRRKAFYDAGGFDEDFYLYCEDNAFCLAVRRAGWRIMYTPHAKGIHDESQSTSVTQNIHAIMQQSHRLLKEKWAWYFELNKNNSMGVFE